MEKDVEHKNEKVESNVVVSPLPTRYPQGNEDFARRKKYVKFGSKVICPTDLSRNILNVKNKLYGTVPQLLKTPVSPLFASIVYSYLQIPNLDETNFVENPQTKNLSEEEKNLMGVFLKRTAIQQGLPHIVESENIKTRKRELKIMIGIRQAGNNSPEMALNILKTAKYLKNKGALSRQMMHDIVHELSQPV